jgi:hypothetical protein
MERMKLCSAEMTKLVPKYFINLKPTEGEFFFTVYFSFTRFCSSIKAMEISGLGYTARHRKTY